MQIDRESTAGYHLISRFVDREWFIKRESERRCYLKLLGRSLRESDWRCLAYAVMSNHIHLAVVAGEQRLDSWVRRVHSPFADWMNRAHDRIGVMFVRGPKAFPVPPQSVGKVIAYIHNNPVRAGVVAAAHESRWSSHRAYVGLDPAPAWLHVAEGLTRSGFEDRSEFDRWLADPGRYLDDQRLVDDEQAARDATASQMAAIVNRPAPLSIVQATADELAVPIEQLRSRRRGESERVGREIAVHCAERVGVTGVDIAAALGMSQQGVSVILRRHPAAQVAELCARVLQRLSPGGTSASSASSA